MLTIMLRTLPSVMQQQQPLLSVAAMSVQMHVYAKLSEASARHGKSTAERWPFFLECLAVLKILQLSHDDDNNVRRHRHHQCI